MIARSIEPLSREKITQRHQTLGPELGTWRVKGCGNKVQGWPPGQNSVHEFEAGIWFVSLKSAQQALLFAAFIVLTRHGEHSLVQDPHPHSGGFSAS